MTEQQPICGVCLGSQLPAVAFGAPVTPDKRGDFKTS
ncbi:MAG: hypothetical protein HZA90_25970 [Verrucomicrobia bacterium]|nr:hypothetical protein [Verrucomicrobiota bacterium]